VLEGFSLNGLCESSVLLLFPPWRFNEDFGVGAGILVLVCERKQVMKQRIAKAAQKMNESLGPVVQYCVITSHRFPCAHAMLKVMACLRTESTSRT
jgi:hypothetical protein